MLHKTWFVCFFTLVFYARPACSTEGHVYAEASVGPSYAKLDSDNPQISYTSGVEITDAYPLKSNHSLSVTLNVNGGYEFTGINGIPSVAVGLGAYFNPQNYHFSGQVIETAAGNPSSTLYNYQYEINATRFMGEIKLTWILRYLSPFVDFGIGTAWIKSQGYTESAASSSGYSSAPPFQSRTKHNLAWQAGLGLSYAFNYFKSDFLHERVSLGYHYVHLGKSSFGTRGLSYPYRLKPGSLIANDVYVGYTHLF